MIHIKSHKIIKNESEKVKVNFS